METTKVSRVKVLVVKGQGAEEFTGTYYRNCSVALPSLSVGNHTVTVFRANNGSEGLLNIIGTQAVAEFTVEPEPFPWIVVIAPVGAIAVLGAGWGFILSGTNLIH